jgi:hypothetical protein
MPEQSQQPSDEDRMQRMIEVHTEMMPVLTQDMVNHDSKKIPLGMHQLLDDHSQIEQMMSQIMASTNNNLPQNDHDSKEPRDDAEIPSRACKIYGEIGHTSKECHE